MKKLQWIKKSIRGRLLFTFIVVIAVPILISILFTYAYTRNIVKNMMIDEAVLQFNEGKKNMNYYFDLIDRASLYIYKNQYKEKNFNIYVKNVFDTDAENFILETLNTIKDFDENIFQVYLYMDKMDRAFLLREYLMVNRETEEGYTESDIKDVGISSIKMSDDFGFQHIIRTKEEVISFYRNIYDLPTTKRIGQLNIDMSIRIFDKFFEDSYISDSEIFYLINLEDNQILFASDLGLTGTKIDIHLLNEARRQLRQGESSFEWRDDTFKGVSVTTMLEKPYMKYLMIKLIPDATINAEINQLLLIILLIFGVTIIFVVGAAIFVSFSFTKPIHSLVGTISQVRAGNLDSLAYTEREDEFGVLQSHFNEMMVAINMHIDMEYKLVIENTSNKLKALQGQINSHFMNNILQSIGTEALKSQNKKVYQLIIRLAHMMQYSMRNQNQIVDIKEEMEYCTSYLELQKHRFGGELEYEIIHRDKEVLSVKVPKMVLQPIVENCFIHGLIEKNNMGHIEIEAHTEKHYAVITVIDNGNGMEAAKLIELNEQLKEERPFSEEGSIGLANVYKRLFFYYQGAATLKVYPNVPTGLRVEIKIPLFVDLERKVLS